MKRFVLALGLAFFMQAGISMIPQQRGVQNNRTNSYNFQEFQGVMPIDNEYAIVKNWNNSTQVMRLLANGQLRTLSDSELRSTLFALNQVWKNLHSNIEFQFVSSNVTEQLAGITNAFIQEGFFSWNNPSMQLQQRYGCHIPILCFYKYILDLRHTWTRENPLYSCTAEKDANGHVHLMIWDRKADQYRLASLVELLNTLHVLEGQLQQNGMALPAVKGESISERIVRAIEALGLQWTQSQPLSYFTGDYMSGHYDSYMIDLLGEWNEGKDTFTLEKDKDGQVYLVVWSRSEGKYRYATLSEIYYVLNELKKKLAQQGKTVPLSGIFPVDQICSAAIALGRHWEHK